MSHTTTLKTVDIVDKAAIVQAVEYLKTSEQVDVQILYDTVPRMYSREQERDIGKCDIVLKLGGAYDVGMKLKDGKYEPVFDSYNGYVSKYLGNKKVAGQSRISGQADDISLFLDTYCVFAAQNILVAEHGDKYTYSIFREADDSFTLAADEAVAGGGYTY